MPTLVFQPIQREITRTNKDKDAYCTLEIKLTNQPQGLRLSICGNEGQILPRKVAEKEALAYWVSVFEENPDELTSMNERCGKKFRSPASAAKYVLAQDGDLHGLDVAKETTDKQGRDWVYICTSCGQIRETIREWFPESAPMLQYHLNDMRPACTHMMKQNQTEGTCPECGEVAGSKWFYEPLPPSVIEWARTFGAED